MKKVIAGILTIAMLISSAFAAVPADFSDIPDNWAKEPIEHAIENGLLNGSNGKINPMGNLTRAEMCAIISRATKMQYASAISFSDVSTSDWFYQDVAKAYAMGIVYGDGNAMRPNAPISRQEVMLIVGRMLFLQNGDTNRILSAYSDANQVASWARDGVAAMIEAGYIAGSNGKINPTGNITRVEFAAIMDRMVDSYISSAETVTEISGDNIMINTVNGGTTLKDVTVNGNLIIGDGVADGDITLENVKVNGALIVRGGGEHTIHLIGSTITSLKSGKSPSSNQNSGAPTVHFELTNSTVLNAVDVPKNNATFSGSEGTIGTITLSAEKSTVKINETKVDDVTIIGKDSEVHIAANASLKTGTVEETATNSKIVVGSTATIENLNIKAEGTVVSGEGTVSQASVSADNVQVNTDNTSVTVSESASNVTAGSQNIESGTTTVTEADTSSQTPGGTTPTTPDDNQGNQGNQENQGNQGGTSGGSSGSSNNNKPDSLTGFIVYGNHDGSTEEIRLASGEITNTDSTIKCVVDLSSLALTDVITSGEAITQYGNSLMIGSYSVATNKVVTVNDLYRAIAAYSETDSISVGALKNLMSDEEMFKAAFKAKTGKDVPSDVVTIGKDFFTVKATLTRVGVTKTVIFEIRLPA